MKLSEVPAYVKEKYRRHVCRATVYNWMKTGRLGYVLKVKEPDADHATIQTTGEWVDDFIQKSGVFQRNI